MKIDIHTHTITSKSDVLAIVNQYPLYVDLDIPVFSVGIHPWYINEQTSLEELKIIDEVLMHKQCLALGECGLDKKIITPIAIQTAVLKEQLLLAEKHKKAVILHVVSAFQEIIALKKELKLTVPLIVHGFAKNKQVAESLWKNGFYLSFGKALLQSEKQKEVMKSVPKEYVFLETDDSKEYSITQIYDAAREVYEDIDEIIAQNFKKVFNI